MNFQHLVEINDPLNPLIEPLTRTQLWHGLVLRAEAPGLFIPHLDSCALLARAGATLERELTYGSLVIRDTVHFFPQQSVLYKVPPQTDIPAFSLSMTIEETEPEVFFVRFSYDDGNPAQESAEEAYYNDFRRLAYKEADIDTIRLIREFAAEGRLELPPA